MSKYRGKLTVEDVQYLVNKLGLKDKRETSAYQYFVEGRFLTKLDLRPRACPELIEMCEAEHEDKVTGGVIKKWLYGIGA